MAGPQKPLWRTMFDAAERRIGPAAEALVRTDTFADVVGAISRISHRNRLRTERVLRDGWHRLNLPAGTDVKRLSEQVVRLERRVRDLQDQLDASRKDTANGQPRRTPAAKGSRNSGRGRRPALDQTNPQRRQAPRRD